MRIISFLELLFACDKDDRSLSFERIAQHCNVGKDDVELLVMKAMSLQLVRGIIDEVDEVAHINWILPRYLNAGHLNIMVSKLKEWEGKMEDIVRICQNSS